MAHAKAQYKASSLQAQEEYLGGAEIEDAAVVIHTLIHRHAGTGRPLGYRPTCSRTSCRSDAFCSLIHASRGANRWSSGPVNGSIMTSRRSSSMLCSSAI